jgi:hypothetical protein
MFLAALAIAASVAVASSASASPASQRVADHWTPERMAQAQPRDIVMDARGLSYLRMKGGMLKPYGHATPARVAAAPAARPVPSAKPGGGGGDTTPPAIGARSPAGGDTIGANHVFAATVTDEGSGVRSVSFVIRYPDGRTQSFAAAKSSGSDEWTVSFTGFWDGRWSWEIVAKDNGARGGNTTTVGPISFTVDIGGGSGGGDPSAVTNAPWTGGGTVQTAAGRIYFEMPANRKATRWNGYVCSGTVVEDARGNASIVLTAAHCVYDDANKVFARNVMFIPDQDATTGTGTDRDCANDRLGCWVADFGVVDADWSSRSWPENIPWDYGYYVVRPDGFDDGSQNPVEAPLEAIAGVLRVQFSEAPTLGDPTHALGYSYSDDPNVMYCSEGLGVNGADNWWLSQCGLGGGSSGGPWMQPVSGGDGPVISVNSWGYSSSPGMAGPKLSGTSAHCVKQVAETSALSPRLRGYAADCP